MNFKKYLLILIALPISCSLVFTSAYSDPSESIENDFPIILNLIPSHPTSYDDVVIEGFLRAAPPIREVELIDYSWINDAELEINIRFIPGDFVPPDKEKQYFRIELEQLPPGTYSAVFKEEGRELHAMEFIVEKGIPNFPVEVNVIPSVERGKFLVQVSGEYPSGGYSILEKKFVNADSRIGVSLEFQAPEGPAIALIVPFKETVAEIQLSDGYYIVNFEVNGRYRSNYPIQIKDNTVNIVIPEEFPKPTAGPLHDAQLLVTPFVSNSGESVSVLVKGYFPSTADVIAEESTRMEDDIISIHWKMKKNDPALDVVVPVEKKYEFNDLKPGNYVIFLQIDDEIVMESKCHVRGTILEPTEGLPFRVDLRFDLAYDPNLDTGFILVGDFPCPGYTFSEKKVELEDDRITVTAVIQEPDGEQPTVVTPFNERIGILSIPDLWERTYYATAIVNGVQLETKQLGGSIIESPFSSYWNWIDVRIEIPSTENPEACVYLIGEFPTPGYQFANAKIELFENKVNVRVDVIEPKGPQDLVITSFEEKVGTLALEDFWLNTYELNVFVNDNRIDNRSIGGNTVDTPVLNWIHYSN